MFTLVKKYFLFFGLLCAWTSAFSQATVNPDPPAKVNECGGLSNGSISFTITSGVAPFTVFYIGVGFGQNGSIPATQGVQVDITGLKADNYLIAIFDGDAANPNYSTFVTLTNLPAVTASLGSKTNNSSCSSPDGQITVNASSGTGSFSYAWSATNGSGPFPNSATISGLTGGDYSVIVSDLNTHCTASVGPITITDPSPLVQNVSTTSPENVCQGDPATISLVTTQVLSLPLSYYEILKNGAPTGVRMSGTGGPLTLTLPSGQFVNGDVLTVLAVDDKCQPTLMNGSVTLNVHTPPTSGTLSGNASICVGQSTNISVAIVGGTGPYSFTITNFGPVSGYVSGTPIAVSPGSTTLYTLPGLVTDANGCSVAGSGSANVVVNPLPVATINASPAAICANQGSSTLTFTLTGTGPTFNVTYSDGTTTFNLPGISNGHTVVVSPTTTTTYTITGIVDATTLCVGAPGSATTVNVSTPPSSANLSLTGPAAICLGQSSSFKVDIVGGIGPFSFTMANVPPQVGYVSGTNITVTPPVGTTNYDLTGITITDSKGCTVVGAGSTSVLVHPLPTAAVTAAPTALCAGQGNATLTFTMTGTPPFNVFYSDGTTTSSFITGAFSRGVTVSPLTTTTYTVTSITDANTCVGAAAGSPATIVVSTPPTSATLSLSGSGSICAGQSTDLVVNIVGGTGPFNFTITGIATPFVNYVSGTAIPVTPVSTTTYSLTGTVTDNSGCTVTGTGSVPVTVNPLPTAVVSGGGTVCSGAPLPDVTFTFTGTAPFDFTYTDGTTPTTINGHPSTTFTITGAAAGTYSVTALSDANTCAATSFGGSVAVVVNPLPTGDISGNNTTCAGGSSTLTFTLPAGTFNVVYTDGTTSFPLTGIASGATVSVSPGTNTTYTIVSVTDPVTSCSVTAPSPNITGSAAININPLPTATISGGGPVCTGNPLPDVTFTFTGAPPFDFFYSDGSTSNPVFAYASTVYTITGASPGTYSVTVLGDVNGCFATSLGTPVTVTVNPLPSGSIAGTTTICSGSTATVTFSLPAGTFDVVYTDGTSNFSLPGIANGATASVSPTSNTSYVIVSITDSGTGCSVTAPSAAITGSADITVSSAPSSTVSGGGTVCAGATLPDVTFTFTGTAPFNFTWTDGTTSTPVVGQATPTFTITNAPAGTYAIIALTDATACPGSSFGTPVSVIVNPLPTATITGGGTACQGSTLPDVTFTFTGSAPFDFIYSDGTTTTPVIGHLTNVFTITGAAAGTYSITTLSDVNNCFATSFGTPVTVTVNPLPTATVSGGGTVCSSAPLPNVDFTFTGTQPFDFSYSDGTATSVVTGHLSNTFTISNAPAGNYSIVTLKDGNGCNATSLGGSVAVNVSPVATGVLSGNSSICVGGSAPLSVALTGTGPWDIVYSDGSSTFPVNGIVSSPATITVSPLISTNYTLVSVSDAVCGPGTVSGGASITVNAIAGNPATFGIDTWLGYVYDDSSDPSPLPGRINFANSKYRGFINETDIAAMSSSSSYNTSTDAFDLNISNNASGFTIHSSNLCGQYNDNFSIRFRMRKTFAQGVYVFTVGSDDGVRLFVDGVNILPGVFVDQAFTPHTSVAQCLTAGTHDIVIEYYEHTGFSRVSFDYQLAPVPTAVGASACVNSPIPTLTVSSTDPTVTGFNWYKDAGLTTLLGSGASFTPAAADLDMTVAATTSFFVTAAYGACQTTAAQADVNVLNSATITPPATPTQACQSGGIIDLTTLVSAVPSGGTFTFSGTGVTTSPNFDPSLVAGTTSIQADYASGTCTATINFNIDVVTTASITVPASPVATCQSAGLIDMTTLVSATPAGGTFTFTGTGVTGSNFDPTGLSGSVVVTVDYNAGGCTDSKSLTFDVAPSATLTTNNTAVCAASGLVDLTTLVSAVPAGGTFTFTGPSVSGTMFDPSSHIGSIVTINVSYAQGGCTASGSLTVTVRNTSDPLCGGGGINCAVFNVNITDTRPSCSNQNDGIINISVSGGVPPYIVELKDGVGFDQAYPGTGPFTFSNLSPANYTYILTDNAGNTCSLPYSLPIKTTVQASAANFVDATCFDQPVGGATITVTSGGASPYEYSVDGGLTWTVFTSPVTINNLMPSATDYSILVRDDATDLCPAEVLVTIHNAVADLLAPYTIVSNATCANNDGVVQIGTVTGGTAPYTYRMDGVDYASLPANNTFTGLSGGNHVFTVIDAISCSKDFTIPVTFPGLVNFTAATVNPDCTGNGTNGQIVVTVTSVGSFQVGISSDPTTPPATYQNVVSAGSSTVTFNGLGQGIYYVNAKTASAQCPTVNPVTISAGPVAVDFQLSSIDKLCFEDNGGASLTAIHGSPAVDYQYQILNAGTTVQSGTITLLQAVTTVNLTGLDKGDYQIQLTQNQSAATGCAAPIVSGFKAFTVQGPSAALDTISVARTISLPDVPTGAMLITIKESGQEPYEVSLDLIQPLFPNQAYHLDYTEASRNKENLKIEYNANKLYAGIYKLSIRDALGCEKTYTITIDVDTNVFIPNIFTPNGDGVNDVFYIRNLPAETNVIITNRWGKEVYRSGDYQNDWTGGNSDDGIYYYVIKAGGQSYNGWLEIQRGLGQP